MNDLKNIPYFFLINYYLAPFSNNIPAVSLVPFSRNKSAALLID